MDLAWGEKEAGPIGRMQEPPHKPSSLWGSMPDSLLSPAWAGSHGDNTAGGSFLNPFHRCGISGSVVPGTAWLARQRQDLEPALPCLRSCPQGAAGPSTVGKGSARMAEGKGASRGPRDRPPIP